MGKEIKIRPFILDSEIQKEIIEFNLIFNNSKLENNINHNNKERKLINRISKNVLNRKKNVDYLFEIGIDGAGFFFANSWSNTSVFLKRRAKKTDQDTFQTNYKFFSDEKKIFSEVVHQMFLFVREQQALSNRKGSKIYSSDFYKWMPIPTKIEEPQIYFSNEEKIIRNDLRLHYCTLGEILFTCFAWRILGGFKNELFWNDIDLKKYFHSDILAKISRQEFTWEKFFSSRIDGSDFELEELIRLKIFSNLKVVNEFNYKSILNFLKLSCLIEDDSFNKAQSYTSSQEIISFLKKSIFPFLKKLSVTGFYKEIHPYRARIVLEENARFPILPYYVWNALDKYPHTYLVSPIWSSVNNFYQVQRFNDKTINTNYVGMALSATSPIFSEGSYGDWSLPSDNNSGVITSSLVEIKQVLEIIGKPLIELAYYDNYRETMIEAKEKEILAGIMARNLSHNFGSHVLGNGNLYDNLKLDKFDIDSQGNKIFKDSRNNVVRFHHYLQSRLDFISRIISDAPRQYETINFFTDLLDKFTLQEALLSTIASDNGYSLDNIIFFVIKDGNKYKFDLKNKFFKSVDNKNNPEDFLIAIPGGITGCHSFYSIVENQIRNAVKYGKKQLILVLTIEVKTMDNYYIIKTYENLSDPNEAVGINKSLRSPIVDTYNLNNFNNGKQGIIEIKKCAEYLFGNNKPSKNLQIISCINYKNSLAYEFTIFKPILIGYFNINKRYNQSQSPYINEKTEVLEFASKKEFITKGAYFGIFYESEASSYQQFNEIILFIEDNYHKLPYRLLLFTKTEDCQEKWLNRIRKSKILNKKRIKVLFNDDFINNYLTIEKRDNEKIILELYKIWMKAFKPKIDRVNILIGFEADALDWKFIDKKEFDFFDIHVKSPGGMFYTKNEDILRSIINADDSSEKLYNNTIIFDNHGQCFTELRARTKNLKNSFGAEHFFSINNSELYQELKNPPTNNFQFEFFIYSLIEACLTKVLIIDERLLGAIFKEKNILKDNNTEFEKGSTNKTISNFKILHENSYSLLEKLNLVNIDIIDIFNRTEIINLRKANNGIQTNKSIQLDKDNGIKTNFIVNEEDYDAVILHHGKFEELKKQNKIDYEDLKKIYEITPVLLWTSGKGYDLTRDSEDETKLDAQFIDFGEVNYSTYLTINKYELGRAVLSKFGTNDN